MKHPAMPFSLPPKLEPDLARVFAYWEGLKRGENNVPFWDDVTLSALPDLADDLMLIDCFVKPERFRFNTVGKRPAERSAEVLVGKFLDEVELLGPFAFLRAQCSATVEARAPTFDRHGARSPLPGPAAYSRLLLPLWGDGRIGMLLGAFDWH